MASKSGKGKKSTQRKLTAIVCADVVGYSRLMGADEEATIETLTAYRKVFVSEIKKHRGRVVDAKGDAILAEFASVVDAVNGAVEIQRELAEKNTELSDDRRMDFRIGINLGDVVVQDDVIYGDGVNVAARLEALAEPGGLCISRPVYDQVKSKLKLEYEYLGEQQVKNIAEPVRAYKVVLTPPDTESKGTQPEPVSAASLLPSKFFLDLPDRPSIAVLPFANMSGDPEQEYFSDGITEDLITDLSRLSRLFVIARNSSFTYKGRHVDVRKVGEELGVRYVLEGSVRKSGERVRITAQLVDAQRGDHLWAQRYDRELQDIFDVQDEITRNIATELDVKLLEGEQARTWRMGTSDLEAYDLTLRGRDLFRQFNKADISRGRRLIETALKHDPKFSYAMLQLGWSYVVEAVSGMAKSPREYFDRAIELGKQAIAIDDSLGNAYALLSVAFLNTGMYGRAVEYGERAIALSPDDSQAIAVYSLVLVRVGREDEALEWIETALRLDPIPPPTYLSFLGVAYDSVGRFEEAIKAYQKCLEILPDHLRAHMGLTLTYMQAGREKEARAQALQVLRVHPDFSACSTPYVTSYKDSKTRERYTALLIKAGLPE